MSLNKFNPRSAVLFLFMLAIASLRIFFRFDQISMGSLSNFTPIGAMALFGGAYFNKSWKAILFPILTLWISDLALNRLVYYHEWRLLYTGWYWTYLTYAFIALVGQWLIKIVSVRNIVFASCVAVLIHWIGTSPGCIFIEGSMYPKTWAGYFTSLIAAIPYEVGFLAGTLIYSILIFGGFEWLQKKYASLRLSVDTVR